MNAYTNSRTETIFQILKQGRVKTEDIPLMNGYPKSSTNQIDLRKILGSGNKLNFDHKRNTISPSKNDIIEIMNNHQLKKNGKNNKIFNKVIAQYFKVKDDLSFKSIPHEKTRNKNVKDTSSIYYSQTNKTQPFPNCSNSNTSDSTLLKSTDCLNPDTLIPNFNNKKNSVLNKPQHISLKKGILKMSLNKINNKDILSLTNTFPHLKHSNHSQSNTDDSSRTLYEIKSNLTTKTLYKNDDVQEVFKHKYFSDETKKKPKVLLKTFNNQNMYIHLPSYDLHKDIDMGDFDKNLINEIKKESRKMSDLLLNISDDEYEDIEIRDPKNNNSNIVYNMINSNNLKRIIKVRKITKKPEYQCMEDFLSDKEKLKLLTIDNEFMIYKTLKNLGPPSFVKNKFRVKTTDKFREYNAKYFGCYV